MCATDRSALNVSTDVPWRSVVFARNWYVRFEYATLVSRGCVSQPGIHADAIDALTV